MFFAIFPALAVIAQPKSPTHAERARGMMSFIQWGALATISSRSNGTRVGDAFGNPNSIADLDGVPYIYASNEDSSFVDIALNKRVSFALSEAALTTKDGSANITACKIGVGFGDPQNPPCARLVFSGNISQPALGSAEEVKAKAALFARHPSFKHFPKDHNFFVAKLNIDGLWLIDEFGGATIIKPKDYFAATPVHPSVFWSANRRPMRVSAISNSKLRQPGSAPPLPIYKAKTARWMVKSLTYGFLATISTRSRGTTVGTAFANPYAFADIGGVVYMYTSALEASMTDIFAGNGSATPHPRGSLALSEASDPGKPLSTCKIGGVLGDPEDPLCARLVLSGNVTRVANGTEEESKAKEALFERHPAFKNYPQDHHFFVAKLDIDGIWIVDIFGSAAIIDPSDYFNSK